MTVLAGADAWEQLQLRQRQLAIAQVLCQHLQHRPSVSECVSGQKRASE